MKNQEIVVTSGDVLYLEFYLKDEDPTTGEVTPHDLSLVNSVVFKMYKYGENTLTLEATMDVISPSEGYVRALVTIPPGGTYFSEVVVNKAPERITWIGPTFVSRGV